VIADVYFLTVRAAPPRRSLTDFPLAAAVIVHARTLLHPAPPQPDAGRVYRCLTEVPGRVPGCLVPLSDLDYELCYGRLWPLVGDRASILAALAAAPGRCDSLALPLVPWDDDLLKGGPYSHKRLLAARDGDHPDLIVTADGTRERTELLDGLARSLRDATAGRAWWPGDRLVRPPRDPAVMPYQPTAPDAAGEKAGPPPAGRDFRSVTADDHSERSRGSALRRAGFPVPGSAPRVPGMEGTGRNQRQAGPAILPPPLRGQGRVPGPPPPPPPPGGGPPAGG